MTSKECILTVGEAMNGEGEITYIDVNKNGRYDPRQDITIVVPPAAKGYLDSLTKGK